MLRLHPHKDQGPEREQKGERDGFTFSRKERIKKRKEFTAVYDTGKKKVGNLFVLYGKKNGLPYHRLGITASKKVGNAVTRNRIKRIFRETFRQNKPPVSEGMGIDFVLVARNRMRDASVDVFTKEYRRLVEWIRRNI
jgi:ribonuclease P protein component